MQVGIDVMFMHTNFCGRGFSGFRDTTTLKNGQFSLLDHGLWSSKNLINQNRLKKFMQVGIDVMFMHTNFGGHGHSSFGDTTILKNGQISLSDHGLRNLLKKFRQVGIDVTYMHTNFGGCGHSDFGDTTILKNGQFSFSGHGL